VTLNDSSCHDYFVNTKRWTPAAQLPMMRRIQEFARKKLPHGSFARGVSILAGGTAISQALAVLASPVLTRLYSVEDFGYFQMYIAFMAFATLAVTLRYEQAIFLPEKEEVAANLVIVTICTVLAMSVMFGFLAWAVHRYRLLPASAVGLRPYVRLIPFAICGAGLYQTFSIWALRQKAYPRVMGTKIAQVGSQIAIQTGMGVLHAGPLGLFLGDAIGRMTGSLTLARLVWHRSWSAFQFARWKTIWSAAVRYRRFPFVSSGSALVGVAAYSLPPLLMAQLYGPRTLGWFALGDRVLGAPAVLVGQAISQVYCVEAASLNVSNPEAFRGLFLRSVKRLLWLGLIPFVIFLLFGPGLFGFVFGASWREAGVYARWLAAMHYVAFVSWPLTPTLNILEKQFWQLGWDVGRLVLTVGSLWLTHRWGWSARSAIAIFGAVVLVGYASHLLISHHAIKERIRQLEASKSTQPIPSPEYAESERL
jgi:O-antigen/teichoic acid export membrane protein